MANEHHCRLRLRAHFFLGAIFAILAGGVVTGEEPQRYENPFQPAPSDIRRPLTLAQRAIDEGEYTDAAYRLGQLLITESLDDPEAQDYFLVNVDAGMGALVRDRLKANANALIASLPAEGRRAYELHFGDQARAQLNDALADRDMDKLSDVIRRFFHTEAGYEASLLAGRVELARGRPMSAALHLQRLAGAPRAAAAYEPELSILLATCWLYADMPEKTTDVLLALRQRSPQSTLSMGGEDVELFEDESQALPWFEKLIGNRTAILDPALSEWVLYQGNAKRNGRSRGSLPMMSPRWLVPTTIGREDEKVIERFTKQFRDEGRAAIPALHPLAVGDTIVMRTPRKLLGVDFASGKRIWVWPPWEDELSEPYVGQLAQMQRSMAGVRENEMQQRVWEDVAHGHVTSDRKSLFLLHELGYAPSTSNQAHQIMILRGGVGVASPGSPRSYNQLVSLSLERQGAAQWIVGGAGGEDEPKLAGAFFLGPPLPMHGLLYAMAEFNGEIRLVVLDAKTGYLQWQQQLAHADMGTILVNRTRRLAGATPSFSGGVLLCPTGTGALVAVDTSTRSLLWGYRYQKAFDKNSRTHMLARSRTSNKAKQIGSRWVDTTVTIADGRVLLTAATLDSDALHCLDLLTGENVWPAQEREDRLYLACVHDGKAIIVGVTELTALRLSDGKPAWAAPVELADAPSGRGFYSGQHYFVPTTGAELLKIDLGEGKIEKRSSTSTVLGNLICFRDEIISQGPDFLATYYQGEPLRKRVEQTLVQSPNNVEALTRYGELLLQDGKRDEALDTLRRANQLDPEDDAARDLVVSTLLDGLRDDFAANVHTMDEIDRLINRPTQRSEYLRLTARGWQQEGEIRKAFDTCLTLAEFKNEGSSSGLAVVELEPVERNLNTRIDRWLQARFGQLMSAANPADRTYMDTVVGRQYDEAIASDEISSLRRFVSLFAAHPSARPAQLQLASRLVDLRELTEAELLLMQLETSEDEGARATAVAEMARLLQQARLFEPAAEYYQKLAEQYGDVTCLDGRTGGQISQAAMEEDSQLTEAAQLASQPWPYGKVEIVESSQTANRYPSYRRVYTSRVAQRSGPAPAGLTVSYEPQSQNRLLIHDGNGNALATVLLGTRRISTADYSLTHARISGHLVLVSTGMEIIAIDIWRSGQNPSDAILWRRSLMPATPSVNRYQTQVPVQTLKHPWGGIRRVFADEEKRLVGVTGPLGSSGVYYMNFRELVCADPLTGDVIWARDSLPKGSDVFGDDQLIFVVPPDSDTALVFNALDGQQLESRAVSALDNRWATCGRNVLEWKQENGGDPLQLRLFDAWSGEEIWSEEMPVGTRGTLVDCDEVALLQPDGRLLVRSLRDDRARIDTPLDAEQNLESLHVMASQDQYIIVVGRQVSAEPNSQMAKIRTISPGTPVPLVTGPVYAFDRQTGEPTWEKPTVVERYGFYAAQPTESPVIVFIRQYTPKPVAGSSTRQHTSVLCLDRRDGRTLVEKADIPAMTYTFDVTAEKSKATVTVALPAKSFEIKMTDQPIPPEAPKQAEDQPKDASPAEEKGGEEAEAKTEDGKKPEAQADAADKAKEDAEKKPDDAKKADPPAEEVEKAAAPINAPAVPLKKD